MSGLEVVASIVGGAVVETGRFFCGSIYGTIKNIVKGPQQLDVLERKMKALMALRNDAEEEMKSATQQGKGIKHQATDWVGQVEELRGKINDEIQEAKSSRCFLSCSTKRYRISTDVAEHLKTIEELQEVGSSLLASSVALSCPEVRAVEKVHGPSIQNQTASASADLATTMKLLYDNRFRRIGIWGMGGVGKTNLVRNLNNKLLEIESNMPFSRVLWVTVSKNLDIRKLQLDIASRLKLEGSSETDVINKLPQRLEQESFLLILDDVWEKIDLDKLGVPRPEDSRSSKIILTSRSLDVCNVMLTDYNVKVSVLREEEAWELFIRCATDEVSSEQIKPHAEAICRECKGLPLAIITMGAAMRRKTNLEVWKDALNQMRRSVPCGANVEKELYNCLKWSYDSLEGKDLKSCFLYCSLFSEDFSIKIDELVWYWLAEGMIDELEYEVFYSRGIRLIENLKDACLLEDGSDEGTVKMHDVVRDVSIWIASNCSEDGISKSLVCTGNGLKEISATTELSNSLKRVSFMDNNLERLPDDSVIQFSEASTLFLQDNPNLVLIPENFLGGFEALRVLNMSGTGIESLPVSLLQLDNLRALLLCDCEYLKELPPLERLSRLQVLNLCGSDIIELPRGLEQLNNLRYLNITSTRALKAFKAGVISKLSVKARVISKLSYNSSYLNLTSTPALKAFIAGVIPKLSNNLRYLNLTSSPALKGFIAGVRPKLSVKAGVISKLSSLEVLKLSCDVCMSCEVKGGVEEEQVCLEELQCLERLRVLCIGLKWMPNHSVQDTIISLTNRLTAFFIVITSPADTDLYWEFSGEQRRSSNTRCMNMNGIDLSGGLNRWLRDANLSDLRLSKCGGLNEMLQDLVINGVGSLTYLKSLSIIDSDMSSFQTGGCAAQYDLLPNLENLILAGIKGVESISELVNYLGLGFRRLKSIFVCECPDMKYLLSLGNSICTMPNLEEIFVWKCSNLEELINYLPLQINMAPDPITPKLQKLTLSNLPKLRNLCRDEKTWPGIDRVEVDNCNLLSTEQ